MINPEHKIVFIILSYLLGSISTSTILCKIKGIDIRLPGTWDQNSYDDLNRLYDWYDGKGEIPNYLNLIQIHQ